MVVIWKSYASHTSQQSCFDITHTPAKHLSPGECLMGLLLYVKGALKDISKNRIIKLLFTVVKINLTLTNPGALEKSFSSSTGPCYIDSR